MGCGQGKGNVSITVEIKGMRDDMKETGVASVDAFVKKVSEVLKDLQEIMEPIEERSQKIKKLTGLEHVHHATTKHALVGMFLSFGQAVAGDLSKLKIVVTDKSPYIKAALSGVGEKQLQDAYGEFEKYIEAVEEVIMEKLPKLVETASELADQASNLKDNA